jgi:type IV pilus assembly protein PilA
MLNTKIKQSGFTIVELLIVIVVIAILAAISIVAYNGIQNRGKASAAQAAQNTMIKKAEAANAIASAYPANLTDFNAQSDSSLTGSGLTIVTALSAAPSSPSTVIYEKCTAGNTKSARITYWNYQTGAASPTIIGDNSTACTTWTAMAAGGPY